MKYVAIGVVACFISFIVGISVDNFNNKQCVKWESVTIDKRKDCSGLEGAFKDICEIGNRNVDPPTTTQECVEWDE